jgi:hypothetical protein
MLQFIMLRNGTATYAKTPPKHAAQSRCISFANDIYIVELERPLGIDGQSVDFRVFLFLNLLLFIRADASLGVFSVSPIPISS